MGAFAVTCEFSYKSEREVFLTFHPNQINSLQELSCWTLLYLECAHGPTSLTHPILSSKAQGCKYIWKPSKPCHVGIHWIDLAKYSQMSTHMPGFQWFLRIFVLFCISQMCHQQHTARVKQNSPIWAIFIFKTNENNNFQSNISHNDSMIPRYFLMC